MRFKRRTLLASIFIIIASIIFILVLTYYFYSKITSSKQIIPAGLDKFGISEIYATKAGGRQWYINMKNPMVDNFFSKSSSVNLTARPDGSWIVDGPAVRLNIGTPAGYENWTNVEITGYAKVVSSSKGNRTDINDIEEDNREHELSWRARGVRHNNAVPCEGTSLTSGIDTLGETRWKKEIWHTGGYTDARSVKKVTDSILGRWIGWKVVMYSIKNNTATKMESYLDNNADNVWVKVTDLVDDGGWFAKSSDKDFYAAGCGRPKDYVITNGGPVATFRSDNIAWELKNLSIREIQPPSK